MAVYKVKIAVEVVIQADTIGAAEQVACKHFAHDNSELSLLVHPIHSRFELPPGWNGEEKPLGGKLPLKDILF